MVSSQRHTEMANTRFGPTNAMTLMHIRDVTAGATGATAVAPKFSDALTLFQPGGADSALPLQRSHHKFPRGYVSVMSMMQFNKADNRR